MRTYIRYSRPLKAVQRTMSTNRTPMNGLEGIFDAVKGSLSSLRTIFYFKEGEIDVLQHPVEFYDTLKQKIAAANDRIFLASLYLGRTEHEVIACLDDALKAKPHLRISLLVDGLRGTRETPNPCSASLLAKLTKEHGDRVEVRLYMTPEYTGWKRALFPKRFNEGIGLQHMKIYGFDDEVILSGANLSNDYFTNRQDRYYLFKSKHFADYYFKMHNLISKMSYQAKYSNTKQSYMLYWPKNNATIEPRLDKHKFVTQASELLSKFLTATHENGMEGVQYLDDYPTIVYPISQFTPLFKKNNDFSTEKPSILRLLSSIPSSETSWAFTAGYFNILPEIKKRLLDSPSCVGKIITAAPTANGFYQSRGISKYLPDAYLYLAQKFLKSVHAEGKSDTISLYEWQKGVVNQPGGWSYHAKGIWISDGCDEDSRPVVTVVGSSNYTRRAYSSDLETNAIILTTDDRLRAAMGAELQNILRHTKKITLNDFTNDPQRYVKPGVRAATEVLGKKL
ncbi:AAL003Wp [Eremothecium gossypii ATCC 10895]|uniref:CDP-diacylglycerol--glycerol-3-phosphate 3-phosphatidyltransferase n=1 Tax=Eremothecium gossypii (strain ATCC 10895 / CBS 109.51 / FGSC 9923 / NRRL Y-1056) TaxID=284811 RepID=Q75ET1_EREGS|nr:AAL003Wp [Eremothecium gossypii ATCC 10895]AAS50363.1 AAL003Wp [Eremothecium gossypii ATCC 10895]AEY94649.1 FAAL003Wp [Eremothecium gossypii FDAG1]